MDRKRFCKCDECGALGLWDGVFMIEVDGFTYFCPSCNRIFEDHPDLSSFLMHKSKVAHEKTPELVEVA